MVYNPFDSVKDLRRNVDFAAVSPQAKSFKEEISNLLDTEKSPESSIHAIVGDYGSGKSHINHYLLYNGKKTGDVLVCYVSCKDILDKL